MRSHKVYGVDEVIQHVEDLKRQGKKIKKVVINRWARNDCAQWPAPYAGTSDWTELFVAYEVKFDGGGSMEFVERHIKWEHGRLWRQGQPVSLEARPQPEKYGCMLLHDHANEQYIRLRDLGYPAEVPRIDGDLM
jgi:hypothetical protein